MSLIKIKAENSVVAQDGAIQPLVRTLEDLRSQMKDVSAQVNRLRDQDKAIKRKVRALNNNPAFEQGYNEATGAEKKKIDDLFHNILTSSPFGSI